MEYPATMLQEGISGLLLEKTGGSKTLAMTRCRTGVGEAVWWTASPDRRRVSVETPWATLSAGVSPVEVSPGNVPRVQGPPGTSKHRALDTGLILVRNVSKLAAARVPMRKLTLQRDPTNEGTPGEHRVKTSEVPVANSL
ncbi:hypothetical protein GHT09_018237 [Marmota monax]|uniref:Uncharacterized protein n=1 Tax=Marmota monax TaxID=9995 RepID=A0A834UHY6_MARMO|nr:hypothetical protein GHT09_018237 [Marmota monax]